jgi:ribonuclease HI
MIITSDWLIKNKTSNGGYNKKQFDILGLQYPPQKGWKEKIIGKELCEEKVKEFENISSYNIKDKNNNHQNELNNILYDKEDRLINISDLSKFNIEYFVYTDGACINNAIAGIGIYFGEDDIRNVSKKVIGKSTNNIAELQAIIDVYDLIKNDINDKKICIVSDSTYALRCVTQYGEKQSKNSWKKDIPNKDLVKYGYELYKNYTNIYFMYVKAHTENIDVYSKGNEGADKLANKAIGIDECPYNTSVKNISNKIYLKVPFSKKEEIKKLGGKWDKEKKIWYIFNDNVHKDDILDKFN